MEWIFRTPSVEVPNRDVILIPPQFLMPYFYKIDPTRQTIIAIGDSFTVSYPVQTPDSYPAVLERTLAMQGVAAQVVNAGIGDSGPDQHLRLLQQYLLPKFRPKAVIWAFYANDIDDNYTKATYELREGKLSPLDARFNWLYIRQTVHRWLPLPSWVKERSFSYRLVMKAMELLGPVALPEQYAKDPQAWAAEKLRLEIQTIKEIAAARGFVVYFVLIAPESAYLAQTEPERWSRDWTVQANQTIFAMLKDEETFIHAWFPGTDPAKIFADARRDLNHPGNRHYNEAGYALLAETIARRILSDEQLGSPSNRSQN